VRTDKTNEAWMSIVSPLPVRRVSCRASGDPELGAPADLSRPISIFAAAGAGEGQLAREPTIMQGA